ncbi:hypothetical protein [Saccharicrinis aurantiacus]|uniref:hypothetical protein n=1 Tax=Saccharicrinis aurantiacus TaxID=1849719 RepID=UPI00094F77DC|nr:hypothetical protein [Saccharicrinis aurantiacus]
MADTKFNFMKQWCYDNPEIYNFDEIDYMYYDLFQSANKEPSTVGNSIMLLQVQNTAAKPTPYLLAGNNMQEKKICIQQAEKLELSNKYEVEITLKNRGIIPDSLQLNALWQDEEDWCEIVDSTQYYRNTGGNKIRFTFKHLSSSFNGFFILMDPGYKMTEFIPEFEPDYSIKEMDDEALQKKIDEVKEYFTSKEEEEASVQNTEEGALIISNNNINKSIPKENVDENKSEGLNSLSIGIYAFLILFALFQWFGPGLIKSCKREREVDLITLGSSCSEANKPIENYNNHIDKLKP